MATLGPNDRSWSCLLKTKSLCSHLSQSSVQCTVSRISCKAYYATWDSSHFHMGGKPLAVTQEKILVLRRSNNGKSINMWNNPLIIFCSERKQRLMSPVAVDSVNDDSVGKETSFLNLKPFRVDLTQWQFQGRTRDPFLHHSLLLTPPKAVV